MDNPAVFVRNAEKSYVHDVKVLEDFSMTVPKGSIYGLLGASGCGKTTLLSCIVGRNHLNSGEICVLDGKPGTIGSGIPGQGVGYMPQEIALCGEFTAKETIYFFGRLMEMPDTIISQRFKELEILLDLPPGHRLVKDCSGGQQRRISFAAVMVHTPKLLILDEPTAGVDPLLRDRIWSYLRDLTNKEKTTVIITTHYIEESRKSDWIGLMRGGKLLAEAHPETLIQMFRAETLEDVFLELCLKQDKVQSNSSSSTVSMNHYQSHNFNSDELFPLVSTTQPIIDEKGLKEPSALAINSSRFKALIDKNWKQLYRNVSGWIFLLFILPVLCTVIFIFVIGADMKNLRLAIINDESTCGNVSLATSIIPDHNSMCHLNNLGCLFIEMIEKEPMFIGEHVSSLEEAIEGIRNSKYTGALYIPRNHSNALRERFYDGKKATVEVLDLSNVKVFLDMSDYVIGTGAQGKLIKLFISHMARILKRCEYEDFINTIISFKSVHSSFDHAISETMIPGFFITFISYMSTMLTCEILISERLSGVWDRSAVAGVTVLELLSTHFILQFCVMVLQMFEVEFVLYVLYGAAFEGSMWLLSLFGLIQGIYGICYGFLVSIVSRENYFAANVLIAGGFYPTILISGTFWPLEAQPKFLRWFSSLTPFTIPTESYRNVMRRGWDLSYFGVVKGLGVSTIWTAFLMITSIYLLKKSQ